MTYLDSLTQDFGRWQYLLMAVASIAAMNLAGSHLPVPFYAPKQDHWCNPPSNFTDLNVTYFLNDKSCEFEYVEEENESGDMVVKFLEHMDKNKTEKTDVKKLRCDSWYYDRSVWKRTIVEDWNLVCSRDVLISTVSVVYMAGMMVGVSLFTQLSDKFGRRIISTICNVLWICSCMITAFSVNYIMFAVMRFFVAACATGSMTITYVWCMESLSNEGRGIGGSVISVIWCIGMLIVTAVSYVTKDWFHTQIILALLVGIYFFVLWFTFESPSWLFSVDKFEEGMKALRSAAKLNHKTLPDDEIIREEYSEHEKVDANSHSNVNILDLFKHPNLRKNTLILYYNWFVVSFVYFALTLNTENLGGNIFVNMTIAAVLEAIGYATAPLLLLKIGRRLPTACSFLFAGICCLLVAVIPGGTGALNWFKIAVALIGRTSISVAFNNLFIYTSEIHPTVVRSIGLGSSSMVARIGGMLAPYVKELGKYTSPVVPLILYGVLSLTTGVLGLFLPETKGRQLPHSIEDGEHVGSVGGRGRGTFLPRFMAKLGRNTANESVPMKYMS